jgi:hypothetical protein
VIKIKLPITRKILTLFYPLIGLGCLEATQKTQKLPGME